MTTKILSSDDFVNERDAVAMIDSAKRIFLLEPEYERRYPPLGLLKIAARARANGSKVKYGRHYLGEKCDLICCTSLFTYESPAVVHAIRQALALGNGAPILAGGVYASMMPNHLLDRIASDKLSIMTGFSKALDMQIPDYSLVHIDNLKAGQWDSNNFSFVFTSRGCPNDCSYCVVPSIEPTLWINPTWKAHIVDERPGVVLCDNNLTAGKHIYNVLKFCAEKKKTVIIDGGLDNKYITDEMAQWCGGVRFAAGGLRLAFDRIEEDGHFQAAVQKLKDAGTAGGQIMGYVLFNLNDTPREADYRARVCKHLGIRPYPQRYQKLNQTARSTKPYVGKYWTRRLSKLFRNFWSHQGMGANACFDTWLRNRPATKVAPADIAMWDYQREKWDKRPLDGSAAEGLAFRASGAVNGIFERDNMARGELVQIEGK